MVKKAPTDREHKPGAKKAGGSTSMAKKVYRGILRSAIESISWLTSTGTTVVDVEKQYMADRIAALEKESMETERKVLEMREKAIEKERKNMLIAADAKEKALEDRVAALEAEKGLL